MQLSFSLKPTPLGRWAVGPLMVSIMCATGSVANAQEPTGGTTAANTALTPFVSELPGSEEVNGRWKMSSTWSEGSIAGTIGYRYSNTLGDIDDEVFSDNYVWDVPSQSFTDDIEPNLDNYSFVHKDRWPDALDMSMRSHNAAGGIPVKSKASATASLTFTWVPNVAGGKPTKDLNVFVGGHAVATVYAEGASTKAWVGAPPENEGEDTESSFLDDVRGGKLFRVSKDQTSGTTTLSLGAESSAPGDQRPKAQRTDQAFAELEVRTKVDTRSVTLSRPGAHDEWTDNQGHTHGDSIYSAKGETTSTGNSYHLLRYEALIQGDWHKDQNGHNDVTRDWNAQGFDQILAEHPISVDGFTAFGNPVLKRAGWRDYFSTYYDGSPTGKQEYTTTYTVTDNVDGAVAEAKYILTLHDPREEATAPSFPSYEVTRLVTFPNGQKFFRGPNSANAEERHLYSLKEHSESGYGASATIGIEGFEDLLGLSIHGEVDITAEADVEVKVRVPLLTEHQECYLIAVYPFQRKHVKFWSYDTGGENKRFFTNSDGVKKQVYHEAFQDTAGIGQPNFVTVNQDTVDYTDMPGLKDAPAPEYDYPSGGSS